MLMFSIVSSITWLENHVFLIVHTPPTFDGTAPESKFHIVTRQPPSDFIFQKIADPAMPFGLPRYPPHHFLLRLKEFGNLQDLVIVASSCSADVGLLTRSKVPLVSDKPAEKVVGIFTMTSSSDDSRRAQLPMTADLTDTSPIGAALDLSSKEPVIKPIPSDEMVQSSTPLPAFTVLNNEGVLSAWWIVYSESVKQGTMYPGLVAAATGSQAPAQAAASTTSQSFGAATLSSPFGQTVAQTSSAPSMGFSAFQPSTAPAIGSAAPFGTTTGVAFGSGSALGQKTSAWGASSAGGATFGQPAFGSPTSFGSAAAPKAQGVAFGGPASLGIRSSPWSQPSSLGNSGSHNFGSPTTGSSSAFGASTAGTVPAAGGFASFANKNGFAAAAAQGSGQSIFGAGATPLSTNSSDSKVESIFGSSSAGAGNKQDSLFGGGGFSLGTTFKPDTSTQGANEPIESKGTSLFGTAFGSALGEAEKKLITSGPAATDTDMDADEPENSQKAAEEHGPSQPGLFGFPAPAVSTTPTSTPAASKFHFPSATNDSTKSTLFGQPQPQSNSSVPTKVDEPQPEPSLFGPLPSLSTPSIESPAPQKLIDPLSSRESDTAGETEPSIKEEPQDDEDVGTDLASIPEPPLPPDPTSKTSYVIGESSVSSTEPDAPLPPDFVPTSAGRKNEPPVPLPLEEDTEASDASDGGDEKSEGRSEEGSGEDIANEASPSIGSIRTPGATPQSSFGGSGVRQTSSESLTKIAGPPQNVQSRPLFGEIGNNVPVFAPPVISSPRSPSPDRRKGPANDRLLRPDTANRSVSAPGSAPGMASQFLASKRSMAERQPSFGRSALASTHEQRKTEDVRRAEAKERREAEESQALIDKEDESIQRFLKQDIVGTRILDDFIAHQDYVGVADKDSIPAQVEAVYRDINSMIDTLGINSCSLRSFIKGHSEGVRVRHKADLDSDNDWCLAEIRHLSDITQHELATDLEDGRVKNSDAKLAACEDLKKDAAKLRAKRDDIKAIMDLHLDPGYAAVSRSQPLTAEQSVQQQDLRRDFARLQKLLGEAEEALTVLRAKLASEATAKGNAPAGPTVEAVMRTITKMTSMAEKRSGDIDMLENQMRRTRLTSGATNSGSRESSPFATPAHKASISEATINGRSSTPDRAAQTPRNLQASIASSTHPFSPRSPARRKISGFTEEEKQQLKARSLRRKEVTNKLRAALEKSSVRVREMDRD
jgi:nucleoporin NUP159